MLTYTSDILKTFSSFSCRSVYFIHTWERFISALDVLRLHCIRIPVEEKWKRNDFRSFWLARWQLWVNWDCPHRQGVVQERGTNKLPETSRLWSKRSTWTPRKPTAWFIKLDMNMFIRKFFAQAKFITVYYVYRRLTDAFIQSFGVSIKNTPSC